MIFVQINPILLEPIPRISPYLKEDWMFLVLLGILVGLAVVKYTYPRIMMRMGQSLLRVRMLQQLMREDLLLTHRTAITFFLTFALSGGLLVYLAAKNFQWPVRDVFGGYFFLIASAVILAVYLWKIVSIKLMQYLFAANGGLTEYINYSFVMNAFLGIAWLSLILIATVTLPETATVVLIIALALFGLAWVIRITQGILFALRQGVFVVYIILYLCALEILPLAVLAKGIAEVKF